MKCTGRLVLCSLLMAASHTQAAAIEGYPTKPIRLIVASSPGGPNDIAARVIVPAWSELLGRPIVIDNRAGAAGIIGTEIAAKATADGYTLLLGFPGPLLIVPQLNETSPYDALKDFAPVSLAVSAPFVLLVHPGVPAKTVSELIALAKERPGKLNYASGGVGIGSHMAMELLQHLTGTRMVHVPYKGAGPGLAALMAGQVDAMFAGLSSALPHIKSQKLRPLALGGEKRSALMPDLPTVSESGLRFDSSSWYGVLAPSGTPQPILTRLHGTLTQTLNAPPMKARLTDMAFEVNASTREAFAKLLREEKATWGKVIKAAGLKAN